MGDERLRVRDPGFRIGASFRVTFSDDGAWLATIGKRMTVWDVAGRARASSIHTLPHESEVDISPDGTRIVVKNTLGQVVVLDRAASISDDASAIALGGLTTIRVLKKSKTKDTYRSTASIDVEYVGSGGHVAVHPAGDLIGYAGSRRAVLLAPNLKRWEWDGLLDYASDVTFAPSGELVAFGGWSNGFVVPTRPANPQL